MNEARDVTELLRDETANLETRISELEELSPDVVREEYQARLDQIESSRSKELQENATAVATTHETYGVSDTTPIQTALIAIDDDLATLGQSYKEENARIEKRLGEIRVELRDLYSQEDKELDDTVFFNEGGVRERFAERRAPLESEEENLKTQLKNLSVTDHSAGANYEVRRKELSKQRDELLNKLQSAVNKSESALQPALTALEKQRSVTTKKYDSQAEQAKFRFDERMEELKSRESAIKEQQVQLEKVRAETHQKRSEIARLAKDNQVYRVARWFFDKESAADLTQREINITTLIWFGSLAGITAWTGTLLAFRGLVVKYGHRLQPVPGDQPRHFRRLLRSLRAFLIDLRRRAREPKIKFVEREIIKTVEVAKEIPVDKVVIKQVPVEVIRKEIVYVPLLTDEEDLVNRQNAIVDN